MTNFQNIKPRTRKYFWMSLLETFRLFLNRFSIVHLLEKKVTPIPPFDSCSHLFYR